MMQQYFQPKSGTKPIKLAYITMKNIFVDMKDIGVAPSEIDRTQRISFDVIVGFSEARTRLQDSAEGLRDGLDYGKVRDCVMDATKEPVKLLETLANRIAERLLKLPETLTCQLTITKSYPWSNVESTSITIFREV
jgi:dihydroneopterin aldolase